MAGAAPGQAYAGHRRGRHPRPVLPGQRRRSGSWSWTAAAPSRTRATTPPTWRPRRPGCEGRGPEGRQAAEAASSEELEWVRSNAKGRQAKVQGPPARATRRWPPRPTRCGSWTSRRSRSRRARAWAHRGRGGGRTCPRRFGDKVLIDDLSFTLPRNGIVGVIGPNGAGKTTLFKMIQGLERAGLRDDQGRRDRQDLPTSTRTAPTSTRRRRCGRSSPTAWTTSTSARSRCRRGRTSRPSASRAPTSRSRSGVLSGGERNRLNLALTLKQGGNLLLLDEPTNDLDVETLSLAGERPAGVPRLRRGRLPRPVVPGPGGHPHPGLRGRLQVVLVRGQLRRLPGRHASAGSAPRPPGPHRAYRKLVRTSPWPCAQQVLAPSLSSGACANAAAARSSPTPCRPTGSRRPSASPGRASWPCWTRL